MQANEHVALNVSNRATRATYRTFRSTDGTSLLSATGALTGVSIASFNRFFCLCDKGLTGTTSSSTRDS
eukprot:6356783-Lingulodinium_polyedra.AAC.1